MSLGGSAAGTASGPKQIGSCSPYPPATSMVAQATTADGDAKGKDAKAKMIGGAANLLGCASGKRGRALLQTQAELEQVKEQLAFAEKERQSLLERNRKLMSDSISLQEKCAHDLALARTERFDGANDSSLRDKCTELEARNDELVRQLKIVIEDSKASPVRSSSRMSLAHTPSSSSVAVSDVLPTVDETEDAEASRIHTSGLLRIKMYSASNLLSADSNGLSDPYVKISSAGIEKKTSS